MKLKIELETHRGAGLPNTLADLAFAVRQVEAELADKKGDIVDGIRLGMRARKRLYDPQGNTIGFADIDD